MSDPTLEAALAYARTFSPARPSLWLRLKQFFRHWPAPVPRPICFHCGDLKIRSTALPSGGAR